MTWHRQVLHVVAKDLRQAKWTLAAYTAFTGLLVAWSTGVVDSSRLYYMGFLIAPFGLLVSCVLVQADSPVRADAFWATRPLYSSAVVVAKVVAVCLGILLPGAIGALIVFKWYAVSRDEIPTMLAAGAMVAAGMLVMAMAIAAFTPNATSFFVAFIAVMVVGFAASAIQGPHQAVVYVLSVTPDLANGGPVVLWAVATVYLFRTRNVRRGRQIGLLAAAATVLLPTTTFSGPPSTPPPSVVDSSGVRVESAKLTERTLAPSVDIRLSIPESPGVLVVLAYARGYVVRGDGRREWVDNGRGADLPLSVPQLQLDRGVRWLHDPGRAADSGSVHFALTPEQSDALRRGAARLRIVGDVNVERAERSATLALTPGAVATAPGTRFQFDRIYSVGRPLLSIDAATIDYALSSWGPEQAAFILVNDARREAVEMHSMGAADARTIPFPLPSTTTVARVTLEERRDRSVDFTAPVIDGPWMRGAKLEILEWKPARTYSIDIVVDPKLLMR